MTLAQVEVGAKTNETTHFQPLLAPLDLAGTVVTFDALHSVKANISWLVEAKKAHYIAMIKTNQPTAHSQLTALPWRDIAVQHTASGHGRHESRSIKTCAVADELGGIAFPHTRLAIRVHRRRKPTGKPETCETPVAVPAFLFRLALPEVGDLAVDALQPQGVPDPDSVESALSSAAGLQRGRLTGLVLKGEDLVGADQVAQQISLDKRREDRLIAEEASDRIRDKFGTSAITPAATLLRVS